MDIMFGRTLDGEALALLIGWLNERFGL